jgi:tetratricopeptide (TPR) repeat protein
MRQGLLLLTVVALMSATAAAQTSMERERARPDYKKGWDFMRIEDWGNAAKSFQQAIDTDREFEDAYYGLGSAQMRMRKYAEAIAAYVKCRDLYLQQELRLGEQRLQFSFNVFNVFNQEAAVSKFSTYQRTTSIALDEAALYRGELDFTQLISQQAIEQDPRFLQNNGFQLPIAARFGVRFLF